MPHPQNRNLLHLRVLFKFFNKHAPPSHMGLPPLGETTFLLDYSSDSSVSYLLVSL